MNKLEHPCAETGAAVSVVELAAALAAVDAAWGACPINSGRSSADNCPKCFATSSQNCGPNVTALDGLATVVRAFLLSPPPPSSHDGLREDGLRVPAFAETGPLPSRLDAQHSGGVEG